MHTERTVLVQVIVISSLKIPFNFAKGLLRLNGVSSPLANFQPQEEPNLRDITAEEYKTYS